MKKIKFPFKHNFRLSEHLLRADILFLRLSHPFLNHEAHKDIAF